MFDIKIDLIERKDDFGILRHYGGVPCTFGVDLGVDRWGETGLNINGLITGN